MTRYRDEMLKLAVRWLFVALLLVCAYMALCPPGAASKTYRMDVRIVHACQEGTTRAEQIRTGCRG